MTAIYSFASPGAKVAFIAADNIDLANHRKIDKITFLAGRYAIATSGAAVVTTALDAMSFFEGFENVSSPSELQDILCQCWKIVRKQCQFLYADTLLARDRKEIGEREWIDFTSKHTNLVILDCAEYTLYKMTVKTLFPPPQEPPFTEVVKMEEDVLHLSDLAKIASKKEWERLEIRETDASVIWNFIKSRIEKDQMIVNKIGDAGAGLIVVDGEIKRYTAFASGLDYVTSLLGG